MLTLTTRLCPKDDEIAAEILDGEAIIINLATGSYYAMNGAGSVAWQGIEQHASVEELAARVAGAFEVTAERARADLLALAQRLLDEGVVRVSDAAQALEAAAPPKERVPYETPELSAYSDMRNLLALDPPMPAFDALGPGRRGEPSEG